MVVEVLTGVSGGLQDPEVGWDNPSELKAQKLARSAARGLVDRDLKPDTEERRRISALLLYPPNRSVALSTEQVPPHTIATATATTPVLVSWISSYPNELSMWCQQIHIGDPPPPTYLPPFSFMVSLFDMWLLIVIHL